MIKQTANKNGLKVLSFLSEKESQLSSLLCATWTFLRTFKSPKKQVASIFQATVRGEENILFHIFELCLRNASPGSAEDDIINSASTMLEDVDHDDSKGS